MAPELSSDFVDLLSAAIEEKKENCRFELLEGNKTGDGHLGEMVFLKAETLDKKKCYDLVVKQSLNLDNDIMAQFMKASFQNEIQFYKNIIAVLTQFQEEENVKLMESIPKCYATSTEIKKEKIVLENLKSQGFQLFDKKKPIDDVHLKLVMESYGQYHGTTLAFQTRHPDKYHALISPLHNLLETMVKHRKQNPDRYRPIADTAENIDSKDIERVQSILDAGADRTGDGLSKGVKVILHGDGWTNNLMFKYDDNGKLIAMKLIDFQIAREGNPVFDLSYFLYTANLTEQLNNLEKYLKQYHDSLTARLKEFGLDSDDFYTFEQLKGDWKDYAGFGLTMATLIYTLKFSLEYTSDDPNDYFKDGSIVKYDEAAYKLHVNYLFKHVLNSDLFL